MDDKALTPDEMDYLKSVGYLPCGGGLIDGEIKVKMAFEGNVYAMTRAQWRVMIAEFQKADGRLRTSISHTLTFPDERWRAAFIAWMERTGADDFIESREADALYGAYDRPAFDAGVLTVVEGFYDREPSP